MVAVLVRETVSITETVPDLASETKALSRFGVIAIRIGKLPTGILVSIWSFEVSITATSLEYLEGTKRVCAKAEDAMAQAEVINSKGRRDVLIENDVRESTANCQT